MITSQELAQSLIKILETSDDPQSSSEAFIAFLEENNLLVQLPRIIQRLESHSEKEKKHNTLIIESPFTLSDSLLKKIQKQSEAENAQSISFVENSELLGGFRATYQGRVIDASLKHNLQVLKKQLTK
jgi:F0F1-type ATP synthase delta subunit